ncbi:MAG: PIN domain-containing protein [Deltaproteobacteria bacterium]
MLLPAPFKVVLDANVLFPFTLRDTLLRAAAEGFFQVYWSDRILDETVRNLVATNTTTAEQAAGLRAQMTRFFPEALVTDYEVLIDAMPNDEKDRHVAAAAVKAGAQVIVTNNLKDFRSLPENLEAQSADEFLCNLLDLAPDQMLALVRTQAAALRKPPRTFDDILRGLGKSAPSFAAELRNAAKRAR